MTHGIPRNAFKRLFMTPRQTREAEHRELERLIVEQSLDDCGMLGDPPHVSYVQAGLEESAIQPDAASPVPGIVHWWSDGEDSRYESN